MALGHSAGLRDQLMLRTADHLMSEDMDYS